MADKKHDLSIASYVLGILSIVFAFFQPLAGIVIGIIGLTQSKRQKDELSKKGKKLNKIGIILSVIFFLIQIAVAVYLTSQNMPGIFPTA